MAAPTQTRRIIISVDSKGASGLKDLADKLGGINKNTKDLAKGFGALGAATTTFLGGMSVRELAGFSDEIQNLNNRLLSMSGSQIEASRTLAALVSISRETNQSLAGIAESYLRMSGAIKDVGVNQAVLLDVTKTISNTFRLSGASTTEAANATIQLGQAFSLGVLRGQDLRSVMSQNLVLTRLLRKEFGNDLLKQAEKGLITVPKLFEVLNKNMKSVNDQAKLMSATFEQSTTKAVDAFKLKVFELNDALGLSSKFAAGVQWVTVNMGSLATVMAVVAFGTLPALAKGLYTVAGAFGVLNPWVLALTVGLLAVTAAFGESFQIDELVVQMKSGFAQIQAIFERTLASIQDGRAKLAELIRGESEYSKGFKESAANLRQSAKDHEVHAQALWLEYEANQALLKTQKNNAATSKEWADAMAKLNNSFNKDKTPEQMLEALNKQFIAGKISVTAYNEAILDFNMDKALYQFKEGKKDLGQLNDMLRKVELFKLNRDLKDGIITLQEYGDAVRNLQLRNLKEDLEAGRISLEEFNMKLASVSNSFSAGGAFRTGLQEYLTSIGTTTQQVAGLIKNAFMELENVFVDFIKNGKFEFAKFTQAILDDLTRIIIRAAIIQPLAQGILSGFSSTASASPSGATGGGGGQYAVPNAMGNIYDGGLKKFAGGGVVNSPTMFGYGGGKAGLMGEAGPEAILPLTRGAGGALGVTASVTPVTVNIINNNGSEVEAQETTGPNGERTIEILIQNKVRDGIASGKYDKVMKQSYGIGRRGQ